MAGRTLWWAKCKLCQAPCWAAPAPMLLRTCHLPLCSIGNQQMHEAYPLTMGALVGAQWVLWWEPQTTWLGLRALGGTGLVASDLVATNRVLFRLFPHIGIIKSSPTQLVCAVLRWLICHKSCLLGPWGPVFDHHDLTSR